jgi:hypothetical protein
LLKFFGINHRHEQVHEQGDGNQADNNGFHKFRVSSGRSELLAPLGVKFARHKKQRHHGDINQISHKICLSDGPKRTPHGAQPLHPSPTLYDQGGSGVS